MSNQGQVMVEEEDRSAASLAAPGGAIARTRNDFGGNEIVAASETASTALAAQARAQVEALFVYAERHPRDEERARQRLLAACRRPRFADVALYRKPVGKKPVQGKNGKTEWVQSFAEGPSIRFVEATLLVLRNYDCEVVEIYNDARRCLIRVRVTDLEANSTYRQDLAIEKAVERSNSKDREVISSRTNSYGRTAYLVVATEDELLMKKAAAVSKAIRTLGIRLIPGDLIDEAVEAVKKTREGEIQRDPSTHRKRVADEFYQLGVPVDELQRFLGHKVSETSPAELVELRAVWMAIKDGETTWASVMEDRGGSVAGGEAAAVPGAPSAPKTADPLTLLDPGRGAAPAAAPAPSITDSPEPPTAQAQRGRKKKADVDPPIVPAATTEAVVAKQEDPEPKLFDNHDLGDLVRKKLGPSLDGLAREVLSFRGSEPLAAHKATVDRVNYAVLRRYGFGSGEPGANDKAIAAVKVLAQKIGYPTVNPTWADLWKIVAEIPDENDLSKASNPF